MIAFAFILSACGENEPTTLSGYIEGEHRYMAPQESGRIAELAVREGDRVEKGAILFRMDPARASFAAERAEAAAEAAGALAAENGALDQQIAEAEAALELARQKFSRSKRLAPDGAIPRARYDADAAALKMAEAEFDRLHAMRASAVREWEAAAAEARLAGQRLADLEVIAPESGTIENVFRRVGEVAAAGDPVLALLPPESVRIRFFAPQARLSSLALGSEITFACDGCSARAATVAFVATEPQFTPPVIFSVEERDRLVFLVEARPEDSSGLRPGMPVTVELEP